MALRDMSGLRLWIALSFLSLVHLAHAADTSTAGPEISYLCTAWSILIVIISAFGLAVFGGVLLYYLDNLSYHVFFQTGVYDMLRGEIVERRRFSETTLSLLVYSTMGTIFKYIGLLFTHVIHSLMGSQAAVYWIILWQFEIQVYVAICRGFIALEHGSFLHTLIQIVNCLLSTLAGRRFGYHWRWMTLLGSLLHVLLIGLFHLWLRLGA